MNSVIEDVILNNCKIHGNCTIENNWSYISQEPVSSVITSSNVYTIAKNIVAEGLRQMSPNELAEILCTNLIYEMDDDNKYKNLLQLANNDYLHVLKCILEGKDAKNNKL